MKTVYLDTSDFSRFADVRRGTGKSRNKEIFEYLLSKKEEGKIEFRYSIAHISELFNSSSKYQEENLARAQVIEDLCGEKAFIYIWDIWVFEILSAIQNNIRNINFDIPRGYHKSDEGKWYPNVKDELLGINRLLRMVKSQLKSDTALNRHDRRACFAKIKKNGTKEIWAQAIKSDLAINPIFKLVIRRYLNGEILQKRIIEETIKELSRPTNIFLPNDPRVEKYGNSLSIEIKRLGKQLENGINSFREIIDNLIGMESKNFLKKNVPSEYKSINPKLAEKIFHTEMKENNKNLFKRNGVEIQDCLKLCNVEGFESTPSIQAYYMFIYAYIKNHALTDRKVKISDSGDAYHILYAPYSNIFRTDKFIASIIRKYEESFNTYIVDDLENLPERIEAILN